MGDALKKHMDSQEKIIDIQSITFRYPVSSVPALENVSLSIRRGEFLWILGPTGAGKSTLCYCIKGLVPNSITGKIEGSIRVLGNDILTNPPDDLAAHIAIVLQDPEVQIVGLTVAEDLAYGPENLMFKPEEIRIKSLDLLSTVGLSGFMERETYALSGGEKQRLAIASALMLGPQILILDEPTSELDPIGKSKLFELLRKLKHESNLTIILVEHETDQVLEMADRMIIMDKGKIVAEGIPNDVILNKQIFERAGGERSPASAEVCWYLLKNKILKSNELTLNIEKLINIIRKLIHEK